jgi:hypothetical protein
MTSSFREDLYNLTLNNNYLLDLSNRKTNENVLVIKYSPTNPKFVSTISIEYKNSLNYNANQYGVNLDLKILTYLYFPDNEKNYQFKVTSGNSTYPGEFTMYLNNYQYKIFDNTATNKISNMDIIKKGVYLLCLEIPYINSRFKIEYSNDSKNWLDLDNLLISKFTNTLDKKTLIDTFLISGLNYCNKENINSTTCNNFYKNIEDITVDNYLDKIQTSIYPTSIDGSYTEFGDWSISDINFQNIENINPLPTDRINFNCGLQTRRIKNRTYNPPKYGGNDIFGSKLNGYVSNSNGAFTIQEEKKDITCYTPTEIETQWKNIGCTTTSPPNNNTLKYLSYNPDFANIGTNINNWTKKNILKYTITDNNILSQCYANLPLKLNNSNQKDYIDPSNNILYPGVQYSNGFQLKKGNFTLIMQTDGNLCIYKNYDSKKLNNELYWSSSIDNNSKGYLNMQEDGNLVIYDTNNKAKWSSNSSGNKGGYAELLLSKSGNYPLLVIKDKVGNIIKYLNKITLNLINNDKYIYKKNYLELEGGDEVVLNDITCIYPYIKYYYDFKWSNNNFNLIMQADGNLVIYKDNKTSGSKNAVWNSGTFLKNSETFHYRYLILQPDGNLVIYDFNNNSKWSSETKNMDTNVPYAELTDKGFLVLNNQNSNILKTFPNFNIIKEHLKITHWNNSPWSLFTDKAGRVWKGTWDDINKENWNVNTDTKNCTYCRFRGWWRPVSDVQWNVKERNLSHIDGYDNELTTNPPSKKDDSNNYNSERDRKNFNSDQITKRKPPQLTGGIEKPNYIPGYERISYTNGTDYNNTHKFLQMDRGRDQWKQAFVLYRKLSNKDSYAEDIIKNHPDLINKLKKDPDLRLLVKKYIGSNKDWANPYRNKLLKDNNISTFTNKSMFNNNLNATLLENYENPQCNLENILTDSNCNSLEINIYKNYLNNMNKYCTDNWINSINSECVDYYNKSFIDINGQSIKIDVEGKLKLLEIQEKTCNNDNYFLNDRCIELNYSKPDIIEYQAKVCSDSKNKDLCDELTKKYTNQVKKNISVNMLNDDQEVLYKNNLEKEILYLKCNENNNNVLLNNCNRLINDPNISEQQKINLINRKNKLCTETNINHPECIKYNKENPNILNILKNRCLQNKSDDCKEFCKNNKDDEEFKKTDFYNDICYSWIEEFWWVILLIVLAILGGGFMYFKKKNNTNTNTNNTNNTNTGINNK